jgi:hypothetical protein
LGLVARHMLTAVGSSFVRASIEPSRLISHIKGRTVLSDQQQQWIADADTLFVVSEHPSSDVDASHRGGNPGFIQIVNSTPNS